MRHFGKSQSKFPKSFQSLWGKKSGSKKQGHLLQVRIGIPASYNTIWLKILQDNAFCTRLKKARPRTRLEKNKRTVSSRVKDDHYSQIQKYIKSAAAFLNLSTIIRRK